MISALTGLALISAFLTIRARYTGPPQRVWVFKPVTMIFILWIAWISGNSHPDAYNLLILSGLFFSLAGDVFLMLPKDRFLPGLVSFLVAHVFYILAFTRGTGFGCTGWIAGCIALTGIVMAVLLAPHAGRMKLPVVFYMAVILVMAWQAFERWNRVRQGSALFVVAGALLFLASDSLLAWNRFRRPFRSAEALKLGSYFLAQWLIALSAGYG